MIESMIRSLKNMDVQSYGSAYADDDMIYRPPSGRVARYQVIIASTLGLIAVLLFSLLRLKYPKIYVANFNDLNFSFHSTSRRNLPRLPSKSLFGWIPTVYRISESQILEYAGLDAVVFLEFFKMCIKVLTICLVFALVVISPIRYKFTGRVDHDYPDDDDNTNGTAIVRKVLRETTRVAKGGDDSGPAYQQFLWLYTIFTYVFTFVVVYFLFKTTNKIINMRQKYLGSQNSITDRTVKISGIPGLLRDEVALTRHIDNLNIGEVDSILIVREWQNLNKLFKIRRKILRRLEESWVEYFEKNGLVDKLDLLALHPQVGELYNIENRYTDDEIENNYSDWATQANNITGSANTDEGSDSIAASSVDSLNRLLNDELNTRPSFKKGWFGLFGPRVDAITYYSEKLEVIDKEIKRARTREYPATSNAFLTMKNVSQAQMLAQAVLDPKVNHLITSLAPAPHDIRWDNMSLTRQDRNTRIFMVTLFIGLMSVLLVYPVRYLASLLNTKSISKLWPSLGRAIKDHNWAKTLITGFLPTYLFTILNIVIPFFYVWISRRQGFLSHSDEELSSVSKNFFYIFVNLFLVFTTFGTASLVDTTRIASDLARSLRDLSLFYVDFIILQGLGIFPFKLLLLGNLLRFSTHSVFRCKTPRDYLKLYKPPVFNFGLQLPQPMLIFIITLVYSVMSSKILTAGLLYFIIGYFVSKYQLLYACVHPPHSTGKVWPLIFSRIILGLFLFQITMVGALALQNAITCASFLAPLPLLTLYFWWSFQKQYIPLSMFIALRAIENNEGTAQSGDVEQNANMANKTLDERRELNTKYEYPNLVDDLDGPMIALEGNDMLLVNQDGTTVRKRQTFNSEWDY
ncbi:Calcium permeable stress-gated cation channel 1 [Candida viswanathii]|uniref:Calcium permeable stress-gated cation channel 1 n=1 Tax=Candida viswanathii TaxID=5486 RepID=A0A367XVG6_9ASCO|nr:Calcium permeable stress-gated cation channel 1 [Candida viswanathii]